MKIKLNSSKVYLIITIIYFAVMLVLSIFGLDIVKAYSPEVGTVQINGSFINDMSNYYRYVVPTEAIYYDANGESYVFIIQTKRTFWFEGTYSVKMKVEVLDNDDTKTAIEPEANYSVSDRLIISANNELKDGGRVFKE